ncbi:MAG: ABC-2 transporter permease [Bacilli bacterium]|nr:ABC-2 transporter permease [Bacilli bacterium]
MKALIYKEFKLSMHPICYIFVAAFPLMVLIPSYPLGIGFIYVLSCYPILFLGANKGQQSNDLLYSTLLPVRKKDIVMARIITVIFMQVAFMLIMSALYPLARFFNESITAQNPENAPTIPGLGLNSFVLALAFAIVGYAIADLIFFPIYYKHGKSIVMSTLLTILGFVVYIGVVTIGLPFVPGLEILNQLHVGIQFICLGAAIGLSFLAHYFVYKISSKRLEKVDF